MRVMIVATNQVRSPYAVAPIGAACVVGAMKAAGHAAELLDLCFVRNVAAAVRKAVRRFKPDVVGISIRNLDNCSYHHPTSFYDDVRSVVAAIRQQSEVPLMAGGGAVSVGRSPFLKYIGIPYGICGEGEESAVRLAEALATGAAPQGIPGLITADDPVDTGGSPVFDLDMTTPGINDCSSIQFKSYFKTGGFVSLQTKRGCPFHCAYCSYPVLEGRRYRLRPPAMCVDDMEKVIRQKGVRDFFFVDSVFNQPTKHAVEICEEIIRRNLKIRWMAYCNPRGLDRDVAQVFLKSGCAGLELGLDSATDKTLEAMGKCFTQADISRAFKALNEVGLPFSCFLLFGGPGETWQDVEETQRFLDSAGTPNAIFASLGIRLHRDTPLFPIAVEQGVVAADDPLLQSCYYVSEQLGPDCIRKLDEIAVRHCLWMTPTDWDSWIIKAIQKLTGRLRIIPSWKGADGYGKHMRKHRQPKGEGHENSAG